MDLIELFDTKPSKNVVNEYNFVLSKNKVPLIIDNGSYQCRVGWNVSQNPLLSFRNLIAKPRKDRKRDDMREMICPPVQIGNDIVNIEAMRFQLKTQFDRNVVTHYYNQEQIFDYIFSKLGMELSEAMPHPVVLTEPLGNPNHCRQLSTELLFECYGVPSVCYCIDSLCSAYHNQVTHHGLIISLGYHTTHIIPLLNGKYIFSKARRLNIGGYHIITYLYRLMQMKYPVHLNSITISRMEVLIKKHCYVAIDYFSDIKKWAEPNFYDQNVVKIQLPYIHNNLTMEQKLEKRKELTKRVYELKTKQRKEKITKDQDRLHRLQILQKSFESGCFGGIQDILKENGVRNLEELEQLIQNIQQQLNQNINIRTVDEKNLKEVRANIASYPPENVSIEEWINDVKNKRTQILEKKHYRKVRRQDLARRRTLAAQERMRLISHLARKENGTDDFGIRDEDWDIYKAINRDNDSESEAENEKLGEFEEILRHHDPLFEEQKAPFACGIAENHQLHVGVELVRASELLFQPSMIGSPEAGLMELINYILGLFNNEEQECLCSSVFITGGCAKLKGLKERISRELSQMRPTQSHHEVILAETPDLDSWLGAVDFTKSPNFEKNLTSAFDVAENGYEYLKEHLNSNAYFPTPKTFRVDADD